MNHEPLHARIAADLRRRIQSGEWAPGEAIPSTAQLRSYYRGKLNRPTLANDTVRRAIIEMLARQELRGVAGVAVYVADRLRKR